MAFAPAEPSSLVSRFSFSATCLATAGGRVRDTTMRPDIGPVTAFASPVWNTWPRSGRPTAA